MSVLQPFVDRGELAGAITLIASRDRVLSVETVGYADAIAQRPMTSDSLFWIASTTKPITATLLMMLVEKSAIDLNAPLSKYLPEFEKPMVVVEQSEERVTLRPASRCPTVREAMSHTSGLPMFSKYEKTIDLFPLREAVLGYGLTPLGFEPGTQYSYGNMGINSCGRIIELTSGLRYDAFLKLKLLDPLGMIDTTFVPTLPQIGRLAMSHKPVDGKLTIVPITQLKYPLTDPSRCPSPGGGLFSTAADVAKFGQLILNNGKWTGQQLLGGDSIRTMTTVQTGGAPNKKGKPAQYGLGWQTSVADPGTGDGPIGACGHGGSYANQFWIEPQHGLVIVMMVQHNGYADGVGAAIHEAVRSDAFKRFGKTS